MRKLSLILLLTVLAAGCHHGRSSDIKGSGKRETEKRQIAPFTSITTEGAFNIEVACQKDLSLEVEADDNVLDYVSTEVSNNVLRLRNTRGIFVNEPVRIQNFRAEPGRSFSFGRGKDRDQGHEQRKV